MKLKYWLAMLLAVILPLKAAMAVTGVRCHVLATAAAAHHAPMPHERGLSAYGGHLAADAETAREPASQPAADGGLDAQASDASCRACEAICGASPVPPAIADRVPEVEAARDWCVVAPPRPPRLALAGLERPPRTR